MDVLKIKLELGKMGRRELLKLTTRQKISQCVIGGAPCRFHVRYRESTFCASEIIGHGCQLEKLKALEEICQEPRKNNDSLALIRGVETESILSEKETAGFRVYYRDRLTRSLVLLGKVMERRRKERGNNLKDLLNKAIVAYSDCAKDPSSIFLLGT
jgi:hypothetical protein